MLRAPPPVWVRQGTGLAIEIGMQGQQGKAGGRFQQLGSAVCQHCATNAILVRHHRDHEMVAIVIQQRLQRVISTAVWVAVCITACGGSSSISSDADVRFLSECGEGCPGAMVCACGLCTLQCDSMPACRGLSEAAVCGTLVQGSCQTPESVCDMPCQNDSDCEHLGQTFSCQMGFCRLR